LKCLSYPPCEFESLIAAYDTLTTIAGTGRISGGGVNGWREEYERGPAVEAELSRPHMTQSDGAGNLFIADKDAHAIRKIGLDGTISTVAGMDAPGDDGDDPGPGVERHLNAPNGLHVREDGTVYILDLNNSAIRRLGTDGTLTTLFRDPDRILVGRGLWVSDDESLVYYSSGNEVKRWTPSGGFEVVAVGFSSLGNLVVGPDGALVITDRIGDRVYRIHDDNEFEPIAGNGRGFGGGDGFPALETGLDGVRGVWFHPLGGYFLATHEGDQVWYVDSRGTIHLFLEGTGGAHAGDGEHFRTPGSKVSEVRAVTLDAAGNVIVTEHDAGFIRKVWRRQVRQHHGER
jgi:hypothetical protein